jgi:hypothetical protein
MTHAERRLRAERLLMLARYDHYKMPPAFFAVVRALETDIAWMHRAEIMERDRVKPRTGGAVHVRQDAQRVSASG